MNSSYFIENKYYKWYFSIIHSAKSKNRKKKDGTYYESHHIIPKCIGGEEEVLLTAREHFVCHLLLCKFTQNELKLKMFFALRAFKMQSENQERYFNSKLYEELRRKNFRRISKNFTGQNNPMFGVKSPTKGHKWYNDGTNEYKVSPINKKENWVSGRLHPTTNNFKKVS